MITDFLIFISEICTSYTLAQTIKSCRYKCLDNGTARFTLRDHRGVPMADCGHHSRLSYPVVSSLDHYRIISSYQSTVKSYYLFGVMEFVR